jgi:hypothetical protein
LQQKRKGNPGETPGGRGENFSPWFPSFGEKKHGFDRKKSTSDKKIPCIWKKYRETVYE